MATSGYKRRGTTTSKKYTKKSNKKNWSASSSSTSYRSVNDVFKNKISSYQTLWKQTKGPAIYSRPSPTVLNSFARWIDKGAMIHTVSSAQIARWSKTSKKYTTATSVKNALCTKFGKTYIKAVTRDKSGKFLVATPQMWKGKTFKFPR